MQDVQYVVFTLQGHAYGIEISEVKEVLGYHKFTALPDRRAFSKGIISLRGVIVPVFDLREKFNIPACSYTRFHIIIVLEIAGKTMAIIADEISDILTMDPEEIQSVTNLPPGLQGNYIKGIGRADGELIVLLDIERLLNLSEIEVLDKTATL